MQKVKITRRNGQCVCEYLNLRGGAVLAQGEQYSQAGRQVLRGCNSSNVTVQRPQSQSVATARSCIPYRLQPEHTKHQQY